MSFKIKLFIIALFLSGCSSQPVLYPGDENITTINQTLIYDGAINGEAVLRAIRLARTSEKPITKLIITSPGGDIAAGMEFGYFIKENNWDVEISKLCFSACANYILPAANHVSIYRDSLIGWHGGAMQDDELWTPRHQSNGRQEFLDYLNKLRPREKAFYKRVGVDQKITTYGQIKTESCMNNSYAEGWFYSIEDLEHMGIKNISVEGELLKKIEYEGHELIVCKMPTLFD